MKRCDWVVPFVLGMSVVCLAVMVTQIVLHLVGVAGA